ncbi:unnamed protein product [Notodromas monacha]|uniref:Uncharacterized protein n=1 Tax=Notodromas monacha TaxID=399045 RepID=A0A7R9C4K1_9CRUS|nr:unnamed protein product [Notodromas monacha]CAG0926095.1 unnamed protein product [Notodromas monacha]
MPPMLELALDNLKNQTITPLATDLSNVVLQQLNAMTMSKSPSGKNKVGNDKIKQSMNILTAWLGHMRRYHQQKNKNVQFVPEILRVLNKREQANRNRKWGRKSQ